MNADLISQTITALASAVFLYKRSKYSIHEPNKIENQKYRLKHVYLPLFRLVEANLYKDIDRQTASRYAVVLNEIVDAHYEYIESDLINDIRIFTNCLKQGKDFLPAYHSICGHIDRQFRRIRKDLGLPVRSIIYRLNTRQYPKEIAEFAKLIVHDLLIPGLTLSFLALIVYLGINLLTDLIGWISTKF